MKAKEIRKPTHLKNGITITATHTGTRCFTVRAITVDGCLNVTSGHTRAKANRLAEEFAEKYQSWSPDQIRAAHIENARFRAALQEMVLNPNGGRRLTYAA